MVDGDEFEFVTIPQIRVLDLIDVAINSETNAPTDSTYRQRIFRKDDATGLWEQFGGEIFPEMNNQRMDFIPFVFVNSMDTSTEVTKPPLLDLCNVNLSHYRTSADLEHGAHFIGLPTPYLFGISEEETPKTIGPEKLWTGQSKDVVVGLLEFTGSGMSTVENLLDRKEQQMAILGARMLAPEKKAVEAAETVSMHRQGENSSLASLSLSVGRALTMALGWVRDWVELDGDVDVHLNTDYFPAPMSAQQLTALVAAVQAGALSQRAFFDTLQRGEVVDAAKTFEDEQADIETVPPAGMGSDADFGASSSPEDLNDPNDDEGV